MKHSQPYIDPALLLQQMAEGDTHAFDAFFAEMHPALCYLARRMGATEEAAKDIVSDAFMQLWDARSAAGDIKDLRAWLYASTRNRCLNLLKRTKTEELYQQTAAREPRWEDPESAALEAIYQQETLRILKAAIAALPPECRQVVQLGLEGYGTNEIAARLQISASAVSNQKARAIKLLRQKLPGYMLATLFLFMRQ